MIPPMLIANPPIPYIAGFANAKGPSIFAKVKLPTIEKPVV